MTEAEKELLRQEAAGRFNAGRRSLTDETEQQLLEQLERLNANLEAANVIIQDGVLAEFMEVARDLRTVLAKLAGYRVKNV